jgi:hypothetical protein
VTGGKSKFTSFKEKDEGHVTFGDDTKRKVKDISNIGISLLLSIFYLLMG